MNKADIYCNSAQKTIGALSYQANLVKEISDMTTLTPEAKSNLFSCMAKAAQQTLWEINDREKKIIEKMEKTAETIQQ